MTAEFQAIILQYSLKITLCMCRSLHLNEINSLENEQNFASIFLEDDREIIFPWGNLRGKYFWSNVNLNQWDASLEQLVMDDW